jgi:aspartyl aminopeptidase
LAIHLQRSVNDDGFKPNKETHTAPIIATIDGVVNANIDDSQKHSAFDALSKHHPLLLSLIASELGVQDLSKIRDFELSLFDTQPAIVGGALNEFIFSARLDNLLMSYVSLLSLCESTKAAGSLDNETNIRMVTLFDHEECGSGSSQGADSNLLVSVLARLNQHKHVESSMRKSFLVSADMAHACHPNYSSVHEDNHRPMMNKGLVFKENANQRYATNAASAFILNEIAKRNQIEVQDFCVRNDAMCGSTVGPILSSNCGVRCVDVGVPQFSMHSIRETCGTKDVDTSTKLLTAFFEQFAQLDACVQQE